MCHVADRLRQKWPKLAGFMDESEIDVLSHLDFPEQHRAKIHSTEPTRTLEQDGISGPARLWWISRHHRLTLSTGKVPRGRQLCFMSGWMYRSGARQSALWMFVAT
jgi:hypothetical protein